jgi:hypothetical protein
MNEEMNTPISPEPAGFSSWLSTWMEAITKPNEQTYAKIASSSNAKTTTAFLWVFVGSLINFFVVSLMQGAIMSQMVQNFDLQGFPGNGTSFSLVSVLCGAPVGAVISVLFFAAFTGVVQWVAKMFGGIGTYEQLAYVFAAITVPFTLVGSALTLLGAIPYVGFCFGLLGAAAGIYVIVLELMAVKGVNQIGWGQAAGALFLPGIVIFCCLAAVFAGLVSYLIPVIREISPQIN